MDAVFSEDSAQFKFCIFKYFSHKKMFQIVPALAFANVLPSL